MLELLTDVQQLLLQLAFDTAQLLLGLAALLTAVVLDLDHFVQGLHQHLVGVLQGLDIHDAPLCFPGSLYRCQMQHIRPAVAGILQKYENKQKA